MKKIKKSLFGLLFLLAALTSCEYDGIDPITAVDAGPDAGSPVITILYPTEGTAIQVPEAVATINIRLEVVDDIEVEKVEVLVDGTQIAMFDEFTDYRIVKKTVTFDVTNGEHTLTVIATDISGNVTTKEVNFSKEPPYSPKFAGEFFYMPFDGDFMELVNIYTAEEIETPSISNDSFLGIGAYKGATDSYITVPLNEDDLGNEFSAAFWYKMDTTADRAGILTATDNDDLNQGFRLFREGNATSQTIKLNVGVGNGVDSEWNNGGTIEVTGEWVHIAFSISATKTVFYVNGVALNTAPTAKTIDWTGVEELVVGSGLNFNGWNHKSDTNSLIDELRLFNTALTQSDIQNLINASAETLYMPFDGQYKDMVSNREVTVVGSPGFAGEGKVGTNAYAGATASYLTLPSAGLLSEEFSTTFWYKVNASPDRAGIIVISAVNETNPDGNNLNYGFHLFREGGATEQRIKASVGTGTGQIWNDGGVINVAAGEWVHVAFTISNSESKIYLNGVLERTSTVTGGVDWTGADLVSIMSGAPRFTEWNHLSDRSNLDELRFYNKALTPEEVQASMSN
ncbi:MAG TPA: LamG-like jellyroll fold domain-containing protein [Gillisia sp.]|nr:LamG-like jellyroll fold domain-containing protein [Gillisia sp.]